MKSAVYRNEAENSKSERNKMINLWWNRKISNQLWKRRKRNMKLNNRREENMSAWKKMKKIIYERRRKVKAWKPTWNEEKKRKYETQLSEKRRREEDEMKKKKRRENLKERKLKEENRRETKKKHRRRNQAVASGMKIEEEKQDSLFCTSCTTPGNLMVKSEITVLYVYGLCLLVVMYLISVIGGNLSDISEDLGYGNIRNLYSRWPYRENGNLEGWWESTLEEAEAVQRRWATAEKQEIWRNIAEQRREEKSYISLLKKMSVAQ